MRGGFFLGIVVGAAGTLAASIPWGTTRPAAKRALRAGMAGYMAVRGAAARFAEDIEDLVAEVAHEMKETAGQEAASDGATAREKGEGDKSPSQSCGHSCNGSAVTGVRALSPAQLASTERCGREPCGQHQIARTGHA